ncbi:MAG: methyltransferase domain-containing protein [Candidatus Kerfeldbacteria bacterium]|nr:methyltransferase domain-containing protein [Candidatus Kerfeldbacteria bacterium]
MRASHLQYLVDPVSHQPFQLRILEQQGDHVTAGILTTTANWYPIVGGIPRVLNGKLKTDFLQRHHAFHQQWSKQLPPAAAAEWQQAIAAIEDFDKFERHLAKTGASFAWEWKNIYRENSFEKQNFLHFIGPFITEETIRGKIVLDVGCGSGRFTKQALVCGAAMAIGSDLGESVEVAYEMTKGYDNALIVQADVYAMPFAPIFDIVYSIGVLHHLPQPQQGFNQLKSFTKTGGTVAIWVYNRRHNKRAIYLYEPVRSVVKLLPKPAVLALSYPPALLAHGLNGLTHLFNRMGMPGLAKKVPFSYYANFSFNMKLNDTFDVLATPKSNYYRVETITSWFTDNGLHDIQSYEHPEAGITCQGVKA